MRNKKKLSTYAQLLIIFWTLFTIMFGSFFISCLIEVNVQNDAALYGRHYDYNSNNIFVIISQTLDNCKGDSQ